MAGIPSGRAPGQAGFTLIEMSVVLVIAALLLAAVLQGRQMIDNARYKSLKNDLGDYHQAFAAFRERYNALPGDYSLADTRLDLDADDDGNGNGVIGEDGNATCDGATDESCLAWQHLRAARLLKGDATVEGAAASPEHPFEGNFAAFFSRTDGNGEFGHKLLIEDLPAGYAMQLDQDLDDGVYNQGFISCAAGCAGGDWPAAGGGNLVDVVYMF